MTPAAVLDLAAVPAADPRAEDALARVRAGLTAVVDSPRYAGPFTRSHTNAAASRFAETMDDLTGIVMDASLAMLADDEDAPEAARLEAVVAALNDLAGDAVEWEVPS